MEIIKNSNGLSKQDIYRMSHNTSISAKDLAGSTLDVAAYLYYHDINSRGEDVNVLVLKTGTDLISTISGTFATAFLDIVEALDLPVQIRVLVGKTSKGRDFVTCELA